ncbi:MAG: fimbrillin family protein [Bacteroides sp.]|nr:fimbrillin family protein [Bacteroides sp.]
MIDSEADIRFGAVMVDSRSIVERPEDMNAFRVWAWRMHTNSSNNSQVFDGDVITYNEGANVWNYENPRVWYLNNTYNFYALYPDTITNASYNENGKLTIPRLDIRQTDEYNHTKVVDLMKATQYVEVGMNPPETVNLTFVHMLTNVNIDLKMHAMNEGDSIEVTYILLNGMNNVGSMQNDVWNLSEPSYFWDKLDTLQFLSTTASSYFSNVLMIPQTIAENQVMLYVLYSYQQEGGEPMTKLLETYLPAGEWKAGEKIVYTGTIQVDNSIVFDTPQVESWGTEQVGGTIIIQ